MRNHSRYRVDIEGHLDPRWSDWFDRMTLIQNADGTTTLLGPVTDQAALYGLLDKLRDLGLSLISVAPLEPSPGASPTPGQWDGPGA